MWAVKNRAPILSLLIRRMPQRADAGKPPRVFPCCPANGSSAFLPVRGWCRRTSRKTASRRRGQCRFRATGSCTACRKPTGPTIPTSIIQFRMIRRMCRWITLPGLSGGNSRWRMTHRNGISFLKGWTPVFICGSTAPLLVTARCRIPQASLTLPRRTSGRQPDRGAGAQMV